MKSKAKPYFLLKIRSYPEPVKYVTVWLCEIDGAAEESFLWGEMTAATADRIAEALKIKVQRESSPVMLEPLTKQGKKAQGDLFS